MEKDDGTNSNISIGIVGLVILGFVLWWFLGRTVTWQGFYYPDAGHLTYDIKSPIFESLDGCRDWVDEMVYKYNPSGYGYDYECGKNCKKKEGLTVLVCEETVR